MVQGSLVENQIEDGKKIISFLATGGLDITAAFWVRTTEDGEWTLYIASKEVDEKGPLVGYRAVTDAVRTLDNPWITISEIKMVGASYPMTADVLELLRPFPGTKPLRFRRDRLGGVAIEQVYVYPQIVKDLATDERWGGVSIMVFPEVAQKDVYQVEFWLNEVLPMVPPGGPPLRVPAPASVLAKQGQILRYSPPEKAFRSLTKEDYEKKALEAVEQVVAKHD